MQGRHSGPSGRSSIRLADWLQSHVLDGIQAGMKVAIFGTGYVGLVTGTCLANVGNTVTCVDVDAAKIDGLNQGRIPIFEPGLEELVHEGHRAGRLRFTTSAKDAISDAKIIFIAVGTPPDEDGSADLRYVLAVAKTVGTHLGRYAVVVNKSTVPVGTADRVRAQVAAALAERAASIEFDVVSNPEFLKEGDAVKDCMKPDRIVIGASSAEAIEALKTLYAPFNRNHERIVADGRALRRADQVRGQRNAGDQDQFHERDRQHRRARWRGRRVTFA
jgi:UDPglucose 6-dehydrogenase